MMTLTNDSAPLPRSRPLSSQAAGEEALVRDAENGNVHFLNPTALLIWQCCDGETTLEACEARLRAEFAVPETADVRRDIQQTLALLAERGLLLENNAGV